MLHILVIFLIICFANGNSNAPEIKLNQGALRGTFMQSENGRKFSAFMGIPYAKPPVGNLRFKAPEPADPWEGTIDATKSDIVCAQLDPMVKEPLFIGNEDCLYINVFTPQVSATNTKNYPVIFYTHGGSFNSEGNDILLYGPELILNKDVILVIPNYRLGVLGFLSSGDKFLPGNNGLKDQSLALKWVKDNIASFGGDPNSITIVGHSAGGVAAHLHVFSPLSRDLFKGVIVQSGTALAHWPITPKEESVQIFEDISKCLNCYTSSTEETLKCLMELAVTDIVIKASQCTKQAGMPFTFPTIEPATEGAFLSEYPADILKSGRAANIPFLTGMVSQEGANQMAAIYGNPAFVELLNINFNTFIPMILKYNSHPQKDQISQKIRKFYFGDKSIDFTTKSAFSNFVADAYFLSGADKSIRLHKRYSSQPVFYYFLDYRGSESHSKYYVNPEQDYGVCHADELLYIFTRKKMFPDYKPSHSDKMMSELLTTLWVNFAKTGNPTPSTDSFISVKWEPVYSEDENFEFYWIKNASDVKMSQGLFAERAAFWRGLLDHSDKADNKEEL